LEYDLVTLEIVDTLLINDNLGFFQKPTKVLLIGDSLLVASSLLSGLTIYNLYDGTQKYLMSMNNKFGHSFFVSSFIKSDYPILQVLDSRKKTIHFFNVDMESYEGKITLAVPDGFDVKLLDPLFEQHNEHYFVELVPEGVSITSMDFYNLSEKYIGIFDSNGNLISRFLEYPEKLTSPQGFVIPLKYHCFNFIRENILVAFPSENQIRMYRDHDYGNFKVIDLPKFQDLNFDLNYLHEEFNPRNILIEERIKPVLFDAMFFSNGKIYVSTTINDNLNLENYKVNTNLLIYNMEAEKWKMSQGLENYLKLGKLAGIVGDTLYYFEASLIESDDKRIYRAVIKE